MMGELYLHIGTIKTGTKFLQKKVFPKLEGIRFYWKPRLSYALTFKYIYPNDKILISDERLSGWCETKLPVSWRYETLKILKTIFPDAKIIITLRTDEEEFIESNYAQMCVEKEGALHKFDGTYEEFLAAYDKNWNNHIMIIKEIKSLWNDCLILYYSELVKDADAYVKKICDYMGVKKPKFDNVRLNSRESRKK